MKLSDKKVIIIGSLSLFILSLLKKNNDKPLTENNLAIVSDIAPADTEPVKNNTGLSEVSNDKGVSDAPASAVSSAGFEKTFAGVKFSEINITRDLYHADHYTITHNKSAKEVDGSDTVKSSAGVTGNLDDVTDLLPSPFASNVFTFAAPIFDNLVDGAFTVPEHSMQLNVWGVREQPEAVKQAKEKSFIFDDRFVSVNGQNIVLDDKSKVTEWDMMPLIDNYGRVYDGQNDVPYIPQFLIFGHVPLGWQLVYFIVEPEKSEEYRLAKEEEEKSWFERNLGKILGIAANLIPVAGQVASALILTADSIVGGLKSAELEENMKELNSFLGRVNGLHGYFGLVPYEWDLPAFFRNEFWLKENDRVMINQYQDSPAVLVKDITGNDYLKFFPWVYRFLGRAAIRSGERVLYGPPGSGVLSGLYGRSYYEADGGGGTYPAGKFADYFKKGVIGSDYNVTIFKYKDWKMTG